MPTEIIDGASGLRDAFDLADQLAGFAADWPTNTIPVFLPDGSKVTGFNVTRTRRHSDEGPYSAWDYQIHLVSQSA